MSGELAFTLRTESKNCSGCGVCRLACAVVNYGEMNPSKAALAVKGLFPEPGTYRIVVCDQCGDCADACPVEAIKAEKGVYLIDPELCTGCLDCVEACPHGAMFEHRAGPTPIKCTLCGECAEVCPRQALFLDGNGNRKDLANA